MVKNRRGSNIWELGEELLVEILCRLGYYKYAIQCKSVCKFWCFIINLTWSDSYFLRRWHRINGKEEGKLPVVLLTKLRCYNDPILEGQNWTFEYKLVLDHSSSHDLNTNELPTLNLDFLPCRSIHGDRICFILSACKDLLLCCPGRCNHSCYYLCNPFTKQWTVLPPPPPLSKEEDVSYSTRVGLSVYDEDHSRGSRFAVVRVVPYNTVEFIEDVEDVHILIFSSDGSNCGWRKIDCGHGLDRSEELFNNVVSYDGDFVWLTIPFDKTELNGFKLNPYLAYTSVYQPELLNGSVSRSPDHKVNWVTSIIGVTQGHLRLAELVNDLQKLIVWQFNRGERQVWEKVQELDFSEFEDSKDLPIAKACYQHEKGRFETSLLAFHPHQGDILYLFFSLPIYEPKTTDSSYTFSCNLSKKRLELIREIPISKMDDDSFFPVLLPCWPTPVPQLD